MRIRAAISLLSVFLGLFCIQLYQNIPSVAAISAYDPNGYKDLPYFYNPSSTTRSLVQAPTGEKPQSKLWYNDGRWWASMFNTSAGNYRIYWLNLATQSWQDSGTVLDTRPETKADCLWDGMHLYVASGGGSDVNGTGTRFPHPGWLYRYSYSPATKKYTSDFATVPIRNGGAETLVIDKDTTGKLWITYTQNSKVYINHSGASDTDWDPNAAQVIPGAQPSWTSLSPDDISTLVAFDGKIGVLWSNESAGQFAGSSDTAVYFAYHDDGALDSSWTSMPIFRQPSAADDHINIKSLQSDASGNIFAMVKTSFNSPGQPQLILLVAKKQSNGAYTWKWYTESIRDDNQTRPFLLIDTSHRKLFVFTTNEGGGRVYYKSSSIDNIQFESGPGRLFMARTGFAINNVTGTKQTVSNLTGIVILASHDNQGVDSPNTDYYFHNYIDLNTVGPTITPNPLTPTAISSPTSTPKPTATPINKPGSFSNSIYLPLTIR